MNKRNKLRKLIQEIVRDELYEDEHILNENEFYYNNANGNRVRAAAIDSPFSHSQGHPHARVENGYHNTFQDYTQLYNQTYVNPEDRSMKGFEKVLYNEPLNIMVCYPHEENEEFESPYVTLGLKTARGFHMDYRFIDGNILGAGKYYVDEETADRVVEDPSEHISEVIDYYEDYFTNQPK